MCRKYHSDRQICLCHALDDVTSSNHSLEKIVIINWVPQAENINVRCFPLNQLIFSPIGTISSPEDVEILIKWFFDTP